MAINGGYYGGQIPTILLGSLPGDLFPEHGSNCWGMKVYTETAPDPVQPLTLFVVCADLTPTAALVR
jgi:hypothetical protein